MFELSRDPDFSGQTDKRTEGQMNGQTESMPIIVPSGVLPVVKNGVFDCKIHILAIDNIAIKLKFY